MKCQHAADGGRCVGGVAFVFNHRSHALRPVAHDRHAHAIGIGPIRRHRGSIVDDPHDELFGVRLKTEGHLLGPGVPGCIRDALLSDAVKLMRRGGRKVGGCLIVGFESAVDFKNSAGAACQGSHGNIEAAALNGDGREAPSQGPCDVDGVCQIRSDAACVLEERGGRLGEFLLVILNFHPHGG